MRLLLKLRSTFFLFFRGGGGAGYQPLTLWGSGIFVFIVHSVFCLSVYWMSSCLPQPLPHLILVLSPQVCLASLVSSPMLFSQQSALVGFSRWFCSTVSFLCCLNSTLYFVINQNSFFFQPEVSEFACSLTDTDTLNKYICFCLQLFLTFKSAGLPASGGVLV